MSIQHWSEYVVLVDLPDEPEASEELVHLVGHIRDKGNCNVVIDFSAVTVLASASLASLLRLKKLLDTLGMRLVLCCMGWVSRSVITMTGLDDIFEIVDSRFEALAAAQVSTGDGSRSGGSENQDDMDCRPFCT